MKPPKSHLCMLDLPAVVSPAKVGGFASDDPGARFGLALLPAVQYDALYLAFIKSLAGLGAAPDPKSYAATHRSVTASICELDLTHYIGLYPQALGRLVDGTEGIDELRYLHLVRETREGLTIKTLNEVGRSI
jgi:hypothetical protein